MEQKPFSLLIKPASADCNLQCKYCFYLDHASLYPEQKIHRMSDETLEVLIKSYMETKQPIYAFGWQGGEPTLMGVEFFRKVVKLQQKYLPKGSRVSNGLQTNATLIDEEFAQFLAEYNFLIGVSLDGPEHMHDQHRIDMGEKGTHSQVIRGIDYLKKYNVEFNILTLINSSNVHHGKEVYNYLKDLGFYYHQYIPCVEFNEKGELLPYAITGEQFGKFLIDVYSEWIKEDTRKISIRGFDAILNHMVYGSINVCHMGGNCCQYFVVEYNGDVYPCDFFVEKEKRLGNIAENNWSDFGNSELYHEFGAMKNQWNKNCSTCKYLQYCSGDCLKHRIHNNNTPDKLSWLCSGWKAFYGQTLDGFRKISKEFIIESSRGKAAPTLFEEKRQQPNEACYCGSGKKYKHCHGRAKK